MIPHFCPPPLPVPLHPEFLPFCDILILLVAVAVVRIDNFCNSDTNETVFDTEICDYNVLASFSLVCGIIA